METDSQNEGFAPYVAKARRFGDLTYDFWIADPVGREWYDASAEQVMAEREWCRANIRPGDTVVDCGSHHGMLAVLFAFWTGPNGRVISYELVPSNREVIQRNIELNGLRNVSIRPFGVADKPGEVMIHEDGGNASFNGIDGNYALPVTSLDKDLWLKRVHFLKVDVEGADLHALEGARRILRQRPRVCLELHNFLFADRSETLRRVFEILSPSVWRYEVQNTTDGEIAPVEGPLDLPGLAQFDNPHVFCTPR